MKILSLFILFSSILFASIGQITALKGSGTVLRDSKTIDLTTGFQLEEKDTISTEDNSKAQVIFNDGTTVTIGKKSRLDIAEYLFDEAAPQNSKTNLKFLKGAFKSITGKIGKVAPEKFKLATKSASIGIRGTTILGDQQKVACTQGTITVSAQGVTQIVPAGMMVTTPPDAPPTPPVPYKAGSMDLDKEEEKSDKKEDKKEKSDKKEDKKEKSDKKADDKKEDKKSEEKKSEEKKSDKVKEDKKTEEKKSEKVEEKKSEEKKSRKYRT
jgi:hypothetical protein